MRYAFLLVSLMGLAGCGASVSNTVTASNQPAYQFKCGGWFDSKVDCNLKASEICPYGYNPISSGPRPPRRHLRRATAEPGRHPAAADDLIRTASAPPRSGPAEQARRKQREACRLRYRHLRPCCWTARRWVTRRRVPVPPQPTRPAPSGPRWRTGSPRPGWANASAASSVSEVLSQSPRSPSLLDAVEIGEVGDAVVDREVGRCRHS